MKTIDSVELKKRTQKFAVDIIKLASKLPDNETGNLFKREILRSGLSIGANYRASLRPKPARDFISLILEDLDDTQYWLEIIALADLIKTPEVSKAWDEAELLIKVFNDTHKTTKTSKAV
jgi:four helix bundle protein